MEVKSQAGVSQHHSSFVLVVGPWLQVVLIIQLIYVFSTRDRRAVYARMAPRLEGEKSVGDLHSSVSL